MMECEPRLPCFTAYKYQSQTLISASVALAFNLVYCPGSGLFDVLSLLVN